MIYAFLNQNALARRGSRVLLIDADAQQSSMKWSTLRAGRTGLASSLWRSRPCTRELGPIYADYTDIVIDGPPRIHDLAKSIILAALWP
jgi:chromosome partitioning protein